MGKRATAKQIAWRKKFASMYGRKKRSATVRRASTASRASVPRKGRRRMKFNFGGITKKVTRKQTLGSAGVGLASNWVPPEFQSVAMVVGGAVVGSDALVDVGAYAAGRQVGRLFDLPGTTSGGVDI